MPWCGGGRLNAQGCVGNWVASQPRPALSRDVPAPHPASAAHQPAALPPNPTHPPPPPPAPHQVGGDFDPEEYDRQMAAAFGDDYYAAVRGAGQRSAAQGARLLADRLRVSSDRRPPVPAPAPPLRPHLR